MMPEQFETINAQLIEAAKTVKERDRILSLMAAIDRQLSQRQRELSLLVTQLKYKRANVAAVAGIVFYALLGRKKEVMTTETAEYAQLKMATEACRITIASLTNQLRNLENELVLLADCDELYAASKQRQIEFLISLNTPKSELLAWFNNKLNEGRSDQEALQGLLDISEKVLKIIEEMQISSGKALALAPKLQVWLDAYQSKLQAISFQYSSPLQAKKATKGQSEGSSVVTGIGLMGIALALASAAVSADDLLPLHWLQTDLSEWLPHVDRLKGQVLRKRQILVDKLAWLNGEMDRYQGEMEALIDVMREFGDEL